MKKKELFKINQELYSQNMDYTSQIKELKKEISTLEDEISKLTAERDELLKKSNITNPLKKLEEKVTSQAELSDDTLYGSSVIGKIVVSATKHCNNLTSDHNGETTKELVNLILGRTEIAKAEILKTLSSDLNTEEKKKAIEEQKKSAEDYFHSVIAQIK